MSDQDLLRNIPSVSDLLASRAGRTLCDEFGEGLVKLLLRRVLGEVRKEIMDNGAKAVPDADQIAERLRPLLVRTATPAGRRAINATGILLHTGLGRAPLCAEALEAISKFDHYSVLQADVATGKRSLREEKIERMLMELTGCEAATVVNNNAAATLLILNTVAAGKEVVVSRGQLVEIGGAFRMPDVMSRSSAIMREIGTTNRTHLRDYEAAINENTGALMHVHTSNYRVRGFAGTPDITQLCELGRKRKVPVLDDIGSGALVPLAPFGISSEPLVADSVKAGSMLICFSGDKLICGPQSGIIVGKRKWIQRIRKNPLARIVRVCKMTLAGLEATLVHFINGTYRKAIPFYRMMSAGKEELETRARKVVEKLGTIPGFKVTIEDDVTFIGSGSIPDEGLPSRVVRITPEGKPEIVDDLALKLRVGVPSVFCRIHKEGLAFDMRTLHEDELTPLSEALLRILRSAAAK
jgi:L-seryl-tRNA(Ser) seleniumtransferase